MGVFEGYLAQMLVFICIYGILALSLNLITGFTGMLNLGHAAFFAIGAYTSTILVKYAGLPFIVGIIAAALLAALFGLLLGIPCLRLRGDYLAITTLGFSEVINAILRNWVDVTRGPMGIPGIPHASLFTIVFNTPAKFLILAGTCAVLTFWIIQRIVHSPFGRVLKAIREDEIATQALGKDITHFKILALVIGAFFAGIAGSLFAHYITFIDPSSFGLVESVLLVWMTVIGGLGSLWGSVIGAVLFVALYEPLRFLCSPLSIVCFPANIDAALRLIIWSLFVILLMHLRPSGMIGEKIFTHQDKGKVSSKGAL